MFWILFYLEAALDSPAEQIHLHAHVLVFCKPPPAPVRDQIYFYNGMVIPDNSLEEGRGGWRSCNRDSNLPHRVCRQSLHRRDGQRSQGVRATASSARGKESPAAAVLDTGGLRAIAGYEQPAQRQGCNVYQRILVVDIGVGAV